MLFNHATLFCGSSGGGFGMCCGMCFSSCCGAGCGYCSECVGNATCNNTLCSSCLTGSCKCSGCLNLICTTFCEITAGTNTSICANTDVSACLPFAGIDASGNDIYQNQDGSLVYTDGSAATRADIACNCGACRGTPCSPRTCGSTDQPPSARPSASGGSAGAPSGGGSGGGGSNNDKEEDNDKSRKRKFDQFSEQDHERDRNQPEGGNNESDDFGESLHTISNTCC